jgi:predicted nucleic acid-binding protein
LVTFRGGTCAIKAGDDAFVLDCSVAVTWCFEDEATLATDALLYRLDAETAAVPALFPLELGSLLVMAERRRRIHAARIAEFLAFLGDLSVAVDHATAERALREILALARRERLTAYDAAYLELAMRLGVPLATRDQPPRRAAARTGTQVLGS